MSQALMFALASGVLAILYGAWSVRWILAQPEGNERMREIAAGAPERVILDLSRVEFLDSSGLGAVIAVMKMLGPDRRLELAALGPAVERVVRLTRMDTVFTIHAEAP